MTMTSRKAIQMEIPNIELAMMHREKLRAHMLSGHVYMHGTGLASS